MQEVFISSLSPADRESIIIGEFTRSCLLSREQFEKCLGHIQRCVILRISRVYTYTLVRSMHARGNRLNNFHCSQTAGQETADAKAIVLLWRPRRLFCAKPQIWDKSERAWPALHASHNLLQNVQRQWTARWIKFEFNPDFSIDLSEHWNVYCNSVDTKYHWHPPANCPSQTETN